MQAGFSRAMTRPVTGLTLLVFVAVSLPTPALAQLPTLENASPVSDTSRSGQLETDYILGGGDRVFIDIFQVPQYSGEYQIPIDGVLYLPLIGAIRVGGSTLNQATNAISSAYGAFLKRPITTVRLLSPRPLNVFVSGEVTSPGSFTLSLIGGAGDDPGVQYPTLTQAITQAGGVTLAADISQIQLRRRLPGNVPEQVVTVNLQELLQSGAQAQSLTLRDGDTIFIPSATTVSLPETRQLATVGFASDISKPRTVAVVGEVNRPGSYIVLGVATQDNAQTGIAGGLPTVTSAIQQAEGIKPLADIRRIQLRRLTKTGGEQLIDVNLWELLQTGDISQDAILQDGDTIIVPKSSDILPAEATELASARFSPTTIGVSVIGEVENPGIVQLPPNTPLNQALLTAGGFDNPRARRQAVDLVRLNPDGTVSKRQIPVNLAQGINDENNPILRNNDIIVVSRSRTTGFLDTLNAVFSPASAALAFLSIPNRIAGILDLLGIINLDNDDDE
ncbi:MAG: SLBB domain-containing protein [Kastovskya adunca ATA6-11-RM4]|jgi:polysaccharide export outer membrane protein|nr:SLBB domain-containing protein [Kastovskya adunca ATA6-11-RM4]